MKNDNDKTSAEKLKAMQERLNKHIQENCMIDMLKPSPFMQFATTDMARIPESSVNHAVDALRYGTSGVDCLPQNGPKIEHTISITLGCQTFDKEDAIDFFTDEADMYYTLFDSDIAYQDAGDYFNWALLLQLSGELDIFNLENEIDFKWRKTC